MHRNANTYSLTPAEVTAMTALTVENLRDWRRRDLLEGFGQLQENGRWLYSGRDVLLLGLAKVLVQSGQSIPFALWIANECELSVRHAIAPSEDYAAFAARYFLFWSEKAGTPWIRQAGFELQKLGTNDLADVAKAKAPGVFVVDTAQLAAAVPELLRTMVEWG